MKVSDMRNLFVAINKKENFNILICATDQIQATSLALEYYREAGLDGYGEVRRFNDVNINIDCDYVIMPKE